jgi:excinuclease ABC subunit A
LCHASCDGTLFIFDEPTTGLHFDDIAKLLDAFQRLIHNGGSILIIEHNLDVVRSADWIIDLGPEGGDLGGRIIAQGTPEQIAECRTSYTGRYLKKELVASAG